MPTRITVNGVTYDRVEAMPPDVRRVYERTLAPFADSLEGDGGGAPEVFEGDAGPLHWRTTVQRKLVVNGTTYENEAAMPADVRQTYQQAMRAVKSSDPTVKKNEIKMTFQVTGPGFTFGKGAGATSQRPKLLGPDSAAPIPGMPPPAPIEPESVEGRMRRALLLGVCIGAGVVLFLYLTSR